MKKRNVILFLALILIIILFMYACGKAEKQAAIETEINSHSSNTASAAFTEDNETSMQVTESASSVPTNSISAPVQVSISPSVANTTSSTTKPTDIPTLKPSQTVNKTPSENPTQTPKPAPTSTPKVDNDIKKMTITIPQLAVRKYAGTEYATTGFLYFGNAITVNGKTSDGWYKISFNGSDGYVDGKYLSNYPYNTQSYVPDTPMYKTPSSTPVPSTPKPSTPIPSTPKPSTPAPSPSETEKTTGTDDPGIVIPTDISIFRSPSEVPEIISYNMSLMAYSTVQSTNQKYSMTNFVDPYKPYTYTELLNDINQLTDYYDFISSGEIGKSFYDRSIPYLKIGKGSKKLFICASVHAREYISTSYIMEVVEQYAYYYANDMTFGNFRVKKLLDTYSIWIVPMVNPDGVAIVTEPGKINLNTLASYVGSNWVGSETLIKWKSNGRGVDLNNNFDAQWSAVKTGSDVPAYMSYKGTKAESEPESKALADFCRKNKFDAAISLHTKGEIVYWDDALTPNIPKSEIFTDAICNLTGYVRMPRTTSASGYGGGFENWFKKAFNKPGLCVELTPVGNGEKPHDPSGFNSLVWNKAKYLPLIAIESLL